MRSNLTSIAAWEELGGGKSAGGFEGLFNTNQLYAATMWRHTSRDVHL